MYNSSGSVVVNMQAKLAHLGLLAEAQTSLQQAAGFEARTRSEAAQAHQQVTLKHHTHAHDVRLLQSKAACKLLTFTTRCPPAEHLKMVSVAYKPLASPQ